MMSEPVKFCKDCKHYRDYRPRFRLWADYDMFPPDCVSPQLSVDIVTGEPGMKDATMCRYNEKYCGQVAKWFEAK
jgi:hypothetical protein